MGIFDFDWMDFNHDGKVDDMERIFAFSLLEEDERRMQKQKQKPAELWEDEQLLQEPAELWDDADDEADDSGEDDDWL